MQSLLNNKCVKYVNFDESSEGQGQIGFHGGELYDGEIINEQPNGWGRLQFPDGSYFEGNFDLNGITEGKFVHFNRDSFEGKFMRDRFHKGALAFKDGDSLEGEWNIERARWNLKQGNLKDQDKINLCTFNRDSKELTQKTKGKEICKTSDRGGFCVKYEACNIDSERTLKNLVYSADGTYSFEEKMANGMVEKVSVKMSAPIPHTLVEQIKDNLTVRTIHKLCFGFDVETSTKEIKSKAIFSDLKQVSAEGLFEMEKLKLKFKGKLFYKNEEIGKLSIKKTNFTNLKIKFNDKIFEDMTAFVVYVGDVCFEKFKDAVVYVFQKPQKRKRTVQNAEVMKDMINDIKAHNNCVIM